MGVGLSGNLVDFGIADVFQLIGQQRKTGHLELKCASGRAQLVFDSGLIVSAAPAGGRSTDLDPLADMLVRCGLLTRERAEQAVSACKASAQTLAQVVADRGWLSEEVVARIEDLLTRDTLFEVLRWRSGSFDFRGQEVHHRRDSASLLGAEQILMDGLRMVDEWQSLAEFIPSDDAVFQRVGRFESYAQVSQRDSEEELAAARRVFDLIDARLSVRRVIDLAQLGTFDGMRYLADLCQAGVVKQLNPEGVRHLRRVARSGGSRGGWLSRVAAAVVPLAVLAGMVAWIRVEALRPRPVAAGHIERAGLGELREGYLVRGVRNALETYRMAEGRWPDSLEALEGASWLADDALAALRGRSYYSKQREGGMLFLAPER